MKNIRHANIEVTSQCNQNCFYCFNNSGTEKQSSQMTFANWMVLLESLQQDGLKSILVTGGEPFLWSHTIDLLRSAQAMDIETSVLSNGFRIPELAGVYPDAFRKLTVAQISLDAMNPSLHDVRRGSNGAWQQAIKSIDVLRSMHVPVEISCTVSDENIEELVAIGGYSKSVGASLLVRPLSITGRAKNFKQSSFFRVRLKAAMDKLKVAGVDVVNDRYMYVPLDTKISPAFLESDILTITPNGKICFDGLRQSDGSIVDNLSELSRAA